LSRLYYKEDFAIPQVKRAGDGALAEWLGRRLFLENLNHSQACPCPLRVQAHHASLTYLSGGPERKDMVSSNSSPLGKAGLAWLGRLEMKTGEAWLNERLGEASLGFNKITKNSSKG